MLQSKYIWRVMFSINIIKRWRVHAFINTTTDILGEAYPGSSIQYQALADRFSTSFKLKFSLSLVCKLSFYEEDIYYFPWAPKSHLCNNISLLSIHKL